LSIIKNLPLFMMTPTGFRRLFLILLWMMALSGCSVRPSGIADPDLYPQDAAVYLQPGMAEMRLIPPAVQADLDAEFNERFFSPWNQPGAKIQAEEAFGDVAARSGEGYAENLLPIGRERWEELVESLQRESYPSLARTAITVRNTACREFPTNRPFFLDPRRAGEGYPFDYFQRSAVWAGTPLLVTHVSADGAWYFAEAGFVAGWVQAQDIAWADEWFRTIYRSGTYVALTQDKVTLQDECGDVLTQTHIGALFPLTVRTDAGIRILVPVRDGSGAARVRSAVVSPAQAAVKPLPLQPGRIAELANHMLGQLYGWGGLNENRDCSAALRDLFTPFGIWLPRHSAAQAKEGGTFHDLAGLNEVEKQAYLLRQGVPFYTLVWFKGHIGLYLGTDPVNGEPMLLHDTWGVRTTDWRGREGRALIGRLVITSLRPGEERSDVKPGEFYWNMLGMTVLHGGEPKE